MTRLRGLDVSSCQGRIDWARVPPEFRFVVVKVSEGLAGKDPTAAANLAGVVATGRVPFVYHFFHTAEDAKRQAQNSWDAAGKEMPYRVFIDLETIAKGLSPGAAVDAAILEAEAVEGFFGQPPGIYTYASFARDTLGQALFQRTELARCPLWMADYRGGENPPETWSPYVPLPWTTWVFAQTSGNNSSRVDGIYGAVDHNIFNGGEAELRAFCGLPTTTAADVPTRIVHPTVDFSPPEPPSDAGPVTNE
jgi:GH25 family lysozyme M1 (1,4-beta-N-acetylmuramidase)